MRENKEIWLRLYNRGHGWNGVSIIDSIPHCRTEKNLKMRLNKELWLCFYIEDKVGMEYLSSIVFHTVILKSFENDRK